MPGHFIRKGFQHKHNVYVLVHGGFRYDSKLTQEGIDLSDGLFRDFEIGHVNIVTLFLFRVLLMHDRVGALLDIFKEDIFELVLHVLLPLGHVLPATAADSERLLDLHDFFLFVGFLELLLERLLKPVLEVAHLEYTLSLNAGPPLLQEAPLAPLVNNETLLDNVQEVFVETLLVLNREHIHILQQLVLLLVLLEHAPLLVNVPLQSLVQCDHCAAGRIVQELSLFSLHKHLCEVVGLSITAPLVTAQDHDQVTNIAKHQEKSHGDSEQQPHQTVTDGLQGSQRVYYDVKPNFHVGYRR